jgi:hypothetical protein
MTVSELIAKLQEFPQHWEVVIEMYNGEYDPTPTQAREGKGTWDKIKLLDKVSL